MRIRRGLEVWGFHVKEIGDKQTSYGNMEECKALEKVVKLSKKGHSKNQSCVVHK